LNDPSGFEVSDELRAIGARAFRAIGAGLAIMPSVSVVIPARNEAANIPYVFERIPAWVDEIVLVDGHSTDDTVAVARRIHPDVKIVEQQGRGKGDALKVGFAACTGEIIVMLDADGSTDAAEIPRFVAALVTGADYVKGSRFASAGATDDITWVRRLGNTILSGTVNLLFGTRYTDLCYGYNAFWAEHLPTFDLDCDGFEVETVMNIRAAKRGLWVQEVPSHEHPRMYGVSNLHITRDGWRIMKVIIAERRAGRGCPAHQSGSMPTVEVPTRAPVSEPVLAEAEPVLAKADADA
jgi:glycosyltransferase involved in cell wall biosynthesis